MATDSYAATGRRKEASARVVVRPGTGQMTINGKNLTTYLGRETLVNLVTSPLETAEIMGRYDVSARARGGGLAGQAGAIRLAVARALVKLSPENLPKMRQAGFLTRDAREVERKKYGQPKARKRFQYSKR